jgi:HSP20 family protein
MNLIRYNPNRWFGLPIDRVFDDLWGRTLADTPAAPEAWAPRVDIREEKDAVVLSAELPGVSKDEVKVELVNGVLTISGEKKSEKTEDENGFYRSERVYGSFERSFTVPDTLDAEKIEAEYANGVLKLTLPKRPEATPKKIAIKGEAGEAKRIATN